MGLFKYLSLIQLSLLKHYQIEDLFIMFRLKLIFSKIRLECEHRASNIKMNTSTTGTNMF